MSTDGDVPRGATCSALSSVTLTPPTLLVCLQVHSGTLRSIHRSGVFAVNLLHARGQQAAQVFSSQHTDRFGQVRWEVLDSSGLPYLCDDAFAVASCRATAMMVVGDHTVVVGEVFDIHLSPDVPLLYGLQRYAAWPNAELSVLSPSQSADR